MELNQLSPETGQQSDTVEEIETKTQVKKTIPTRLGLLIILLVATIAGAGVWWYGLNQTFPEYNEYRPVEQSIKKVKYGSHEKVQHQAKIILPSIGNTKTLKDYQMYIELDTKSLIGEQKLSLDCSNIYFTDSDGVKIPFWMQDNECYKKDSIFWLNIPRIASHEEKVIYVYYGNEAVVSESNFEKVFPQQKQNKLGLISSYFFGPFVWGSDVSGLKKVEESYSKPTDNRDYFPTFEHWGCGDFGYMDIPCDVTAVNFRASSSQEADMSQGTIEMWIAPYVVVSENYQKIIMDSGGAIELGIQPDGDLYFYPSQAGSQNYNLIKNPLKDGHNKEDFDWTSVWTHLVVTWNFETKKSNFYIDGKKRKNNIENIPTNWTEVAQIGNKWNIGGFAYAGEIEGLKIYSKALTEKEIVEAYLYNSHEARNPKVVLTDEKLLLQEGVVVNLFDSNLDIEKIPKNKNVHFDPYYATPLDGYTESGGLDTYGCRYHEGEYDGYLYQDQPAYLISKRKSESPYHYYNNGTAIFGYPSHFDAYAGAPITINEELLLTHIGITVNDPELIESLHVELGSSGYSGFMAEEKGFIDYLILTTHACGGSNYYRISESDLSFVEKKSGVSWYVLDTPIRATEANMLQMYYTPNGKEGFLSLAVADMIFQDKKGDFTRPQIDAREYDFCAEYADESNRTECYADKVKRSAYFAYLASEEKGEITFRSNEQHTDILLAFKNIGEDPIIVDEISFKWIQTIFYDYKKNMNFSIRNNKGEIAYKIDMGEIKKYFVGKVIEPESEISMPLQTNFVENNKIYWVTFGNDDIEEQISALESDQKKIIHWSFENAYNYPPEKWGDKVIYKLYIDNNGVMTFERVRKDDLPI